MDQKITLKNKPRLEISFAENGFEVIDDSAPKNNGVYSYSNLKSIELKKNGWFKSLLWYISWLNLIPFEPGFKNKTNLKIVLNEKILKLWLIDSDMKKAEIVKQKLNEKKPTHNRVGGQ